MISRILLILGETELSVYQFSSELSEEGYGRYLVNTLS
jgi:hypothetical protein